MLCLEYNKTTTKIVQLLFLTILLSIVSPKANAQQWEDLYSYNKINKFEVSNGTIYAVAENALFTYEENSKEIEKISSVNGLSGDGISSIYYSDSLNSLFIGYQSGLLEIVDRYQEVAALKSIENFNYTGEKSINAITQQQDRLYLATSFGVVVYDLKKEEFSETYFLGESSSEIKINKIAFLSDQIYVASEKGLHQASIYDPFLIDYNNWDFNPVGNISNLAVFNNKIFAVKNNVLYELQNGSLQIVKTYSQTIKSITSNQNDLTITTSNSLFVYDLALAEAFTYAVSSGELQFTMNQANVSENELFIATNEFGVLKTKLYQTPLTFEKIYPTGPTSNTAFSITAKDNNLWMVYGGYDTAYGPLNNRAGISHYNGKQWKNIPYNDFGVKNLVHVTFDNQNTNKVYISSWGASGPTDLLNTGGILVMENDQKVDFWNYTNSGLDEIPGFASYRSTRINGSAFDLFGNLWVANSWVSERIKKYNNLGEWKGFDMTSTITVNRFGLNELAIDQRNTIWIGTRGNGLLVFNEQLQRKMAFTSEAGRGGLPNLNVRTVKADRNNRIWIGTLEGLVVYKNASNVFNNTTWNAEPIALETDGEVGNLLGSQIINTIDIDGAGNKWFGTFSQGVVQTNPDGTTILNEFKKENSPLPSNNITKISVDQSSGKVYIATDKGTLVYDSKVVSYGGKLSEVYAYPNPSTRSNEFITIAGRNGKQLPYNTNVKIVDSAGNLVYETVVREGIEFFGGKVVWNKRNLAGKRVASGIYIVLVSSNENTESTTSKIAVIH